MPPSLPNARTYWIYGFAAGATERYRLYYMLVLLLCLVLLIVVATVLATVAIAVPVHYLLFHVIPSLRSYPLFRNQ